MDNRPVLTRVLLLALVFLLVRGVVERGIFLVLVVLERGNFLAIVVLLARVFLLALVLLARGVVEIGIFLVLVVQLERVVLLESFGLLVFGLLVYII